jgi:hypothetical protein
MREKILLTLAIALAVGPASAASISDAIWLPSNENQQSQVSDRYDKAIDQSLHDKKLEKAMQNVCRGC